MAEKKYDSTVSFQGKTKAEIKWAAEKIFEKSFLWITVDHHEKEFIIRVNDTASPEKIKSFQEEFKQCRIIIFKEIPIRQFIGSPR